MQVPLIVVENVSKDPGLRALRQASLAVDAGVHMA
jgi:hypothetical protein